MSNYVLGQDKEFWAALRRLIPNVPYEHVVQLDLHVRVDEPVTMHVRMLVLSPDGEPQLDRKANVMMEDRTYLLLPARHEKVDVTAVSDAFRTYALGQVQADVTFEMRKAGAEAMRSIGCNIGSCPEDECEEIFNAMVAAASAGPKR